MNLLYFRELNSKPKCRGKKWNIIRNSVTVSFRWCVRASLLFQFESQFWVCYLQFGNFLLFFLYNNLEIVKCQIMEYTIDMKLVVGWQTNQIYCIVVAALRNCMNQFFMLNLPKKKHFFLFSAYGIFYNASTQMMKGKIPDENQCVAVRLVVCVEACIVWCLCVFNNSCHFIHSMCSTF